MATLWLDNEWHPLHQFEAFIFIYTIILEAQSHSFIYLYSPGSRPDALFYSFGSVSSNSLRSLTGLGAALKGKPALKA